ncbi:MAG: hypothetical protein KQH63_16245 [Desulfobulbaceae bacterium]|nr:hypothetical protein [Desulfobulbaceae bacterium]
MNKIYKAAIFSLVTIMVQHALPSMANETDNEMILKELQALKAKVAELDVLKERITELETMLSGEGKQQLAVVVEEENEKSTSDYLDIGGAMRLNYMYKDWDHGTQERSGDFDLDTFRLNVDASYSDVLLSAEYRFYGDGANGNNYNFLHHGWLGYNFSESIQGQLGVTRVPFGILPYASHNFFFQIPYYVGLEDDYDAGLKLIYDSKPWNVQLAFFKSSEYGANNSERYSYDVVNADFNGDGSNEYLNEESNQMNARLTYTFAHNEENSTEVGISAEAGQLYNSGTDKNGSRVAGAVHLNGTYDRWNLMLETLRYQYNQKNPPHLDDRFVAMGAYDFPYKVASAGNIYMAGLSYSLPVNWGPITSLTFYDDYSVLDKDERSYKNSQQNVLGMAVSAGPIYTYIDFAMGKNQPWLGPGWTNSLAQGDPASDDGWHTRFNVNFGYYF